MSLGRRLVEAAPHVPWRINFHLRSWLGEYPDFFIAGFPKCGTTSLYNYLIQHPDVLHGDGKEQWYRGAPIGARGGVRRAGTARGI